MLPPTPHPKPCKLCGEPIEVGQRFGIIMPKTYPAKKHRVVHVACFDEASGGVTPEREPVEDTTERVEPPVSSAGDIDPSDWK